MNYLVTGCSRGVGLEICHVLLKQGHNVYGVARSYTEEFKILEQKYPNKLFFKSIDLSDSENVRKTIFKEFITNQIVLDGYVNNAAMAYDDIITNLNIDKLKAMYASSKGALEAFSKDTAREWGELGIRSNVVVPGFMETAMSSTLTENQKDRIYKRTSLKSATSIQSVAETVAFLLSEKASSITGQNIHVDNGTI